MNARNTRRLLQDGYNVAYKYRSVNEHVDLVNIDSKTYNSARNKQVLLRLKQNLIKALYLIYKQWNKVKG